jgi:3-oxoacyl-[acyl-carrier protein] reductase
MAQRLPILVDEGRTADMEHMDERMVVVTGAGRGVGRSTVEALVREHRCRVLAISRDVGALAALRSQLGESVEILAVDLTEPGAFGMVLQNVGQRSLCALVHNAGSLLRVAMGGHQSEALYRLFDINVVAPLLLSQALAPSLMGDPPGHIVHIGSMGGFQDSAKFQGLVAYSASKAALACIAQCLAEEFKEKGIRSNCLALGAVDTDMLREAFPGYQAPVSAASMGEYVARFALEGHRLYNGKVLPVAVSTP